jgi:O-antigen/teichoic acid export membrane protein
VPLLPILIMLFGAFGPVLINNASVPWLSGAGADAAVVGAFAGALTLSRVPVQLAGSAFGPLMNQISTLLDEGRPDDFHGLHRRVIVVAVLFGTTFALLFTASASFVLRLLLGAEYDLPWWSLLLLGSASGLMMLAMVVQAVAVGRERWKGLSVSWMLGGSACGIAFTLPGSELLVASIAPPVGLVVAIAGIAVVSRVRAGSSG